ncbi:aquaporin-like isoform X2 [Planococcus citri]|uniref:aquaporin-like isoform X2 n=1 Tax=Planococcus citri TaxID=170843 RepID=UPI0031F8217C
MSSIISANDEASLLENENVRDSYPPEPSSDLEVFVAEFLGTMLLLFFGCLGLFANSTRFEILAPMQGGVVFGFVVASIIAAIGHISDAHLNPAVTLCSYLLERISLKTAFIYFLAELLGSLTGFWLLKEVIPQKLFSAYADNSCGFCTTSISSSINTYQGFLIEFLATSFLILIVCSVWDPRNIKNTDSTPIKFGLFIAAAAIAMGPFTGAGMNPTRSFAPAMINNQWANHWVYWLAPLSGSAIVTSCYKFFFMRKNYSAAQKYSSGQRMRL